MLFSDTHRKIYLISSCKADETSILILVSSAKNDMQVYCVAINVRHKYDEQ